MQFYRVPAHDGQPEQLEATQDDARAACKARGLKGNAFTSYEVRTDKVGLRAHLNDLLRRQSPRAVVAATVADGPAIPLRSEPAETSPLHPPYESPWSARECLADMDVNRTCRMIRQVDGTRLGKVLAACVERLEALRREALREGVE